MNKICVIGDRDSILGFKAVGFDVFEIAGASVSAATKTESGAGVAATIADEKMIADTTMTAGANMAADVSMASDANMAADVTMAAGANMAADVFMAADADKLLRHAAAGGYAVIFITEQAAGLLRDAIDSYKESALPAIIPIPGGAGPTGFGMMNVRKSVERALGTDIFYD